MLVCRGVEKMSKIEVVNYDIDKIYEFVKENIYSCKTAFTAVDNAKFHHNIGYKHVPSAIKHGILSYYYQKKIIENRELTSDELYRYGDECHVNGTTYISLSTLDIDMDSVYEDEWIYDYRISSDADILVSSDVSAYRNAINYTNEFLVEGIIPTEYFKAIDLRLLGTKSFDEESRIKRIIDNYNCLRNIARSLIENKIDVPLRERSIEDFDLDKEKVKRLPKLRVK